MEIWKQCRAGYSGYQISSKGRVRSSRGILAIQNANKNPTLNMRCDDGYVRHVVVARLVCDAFHGPPPTPQHEVGHKNGKRADNRASNVYWTTHLDVIDKSQHKLTEDQVREIRQRIKTERGADLAREFKVTPTSISFIKTGVTWRNVK